MSIICILASLTKNARRDFIKTSNRYLAWTSVAFTLIIASCAPTIIPITSLAVSESTTNLLLEGSPKQITVSHLPADATDLLDITWTSTNDAVAEIAFVSTGIYRITQKTVGTTVFTGKLVSNPSIKVTNTTTVTKESKPITSLTISEDTTSLLLGGSSKRITVAKVPADATEELNLAVSYTNTAVARMDSVSTGTYDDVPTAVGTTAITFALVSNPSIKVTNVTTVTKESKPITSLTISEDTTSLLLGGSSKRITVAKVPADATEELNLAVSYRDIVNLCG